MAEKQRGEVKQVGRERQSSRTRNIRLLWAFRVFVKMFYRRLQPSVVADGPSLTHVTVNKKY